MRYACKGLLLLVLLIPVLACTRAANLALNSAARMGNTDAVQALIDAGANVNAKDEYGWTALMEAAARGHTATVQALLDAGANVNAQGTFGATALMKAQENGHTEVVEILKKAGAK